MYNNELLLLIETGGSLRQSLEKQFSSKQLLLMLDLVWIDRVMYIIH